MDEWVNLIGRWSTKGSADGEEEGNNREKYAKGKTQWRRVSL
jgi:hypothetical protein